MTSVAMDEYNFEVMVLVACVFSNCMAHRSFGVCFSYVPEYKQVQAPICEALNITKETSCIAISFNGSHSLEGRYRKHVSILFQSGKLVIKANGSPF